MIALVAGTRPEIIKLAPVIKALSRGGHRPSLLWTSQHYDELMSDVFFDEFRSHPSVYVTGERVNAVVDDGSRLGRMVRDVSAALVSVAPSIVVVEGDTMSALAGGLAARALGVRLCHVEAGLRCGDFAMFEEWARILIDHMSHLLCAPHALAVGNLRREGLPGPDQTLVLTGNPIADAVACAVQVRPHRAPIRADVLVTIHRAENSDERLWQIMAAVAELSKSRSVVWPVHPRVRARAPMSLSCWVEPLPYGAFLALLKTAWLVVTDSGGVQEEASIVGTPCLTVRPSTERQETVEAGVNRLVEPDAIVSEAEQILSTPTVRRPLNLYGSGDAGVRIAEALEEELRWSCSTAAASLD